MSSLQLPYYGWLILPPLLYQTCATWRKSSHIIDYPTIIYVCFLDFWNKQCGPTNRRVAEEARVIISNGPTQTDLRLYLSAWIAAVTSWRSLASAQSTTKSAWHRRQLAMFSGLLQSIEVGKGMCNEHQRTTQWGWHRHQSPYMAKTQEHVEPAEWGWMWLISRGNDKNIVQVSVMLWWDWIMIE